MRKTGRNSVVCATAFLLFIIAGQAQQTPQVLGNHVRPPITSGQAVPVGLLPRTQHLNLAILLPLRNQSELTRLLGRLYDPSSADYRRFLTVAQFSEQFSPTAEDYQAVVDFAKSNGFAVTGTPANRLLVDVNGTVAQIQSAFHVVMRVYQHPTENRNFYSPDREPTLDLNVPVAHIAGLNNYSIPRSTLVRSPAGQAIHGNATGSGPGGAYLGSDMRAAYYGGTALSGSGQAVGLVEFGGYNLSDVNLTFSSAGQSYSVPINNVLLDGATGAPNGDDAEEVVDIVQAVSMAPGLSQVRVYIGYSDADIFNQMATENLCQQLSVSWMWTPEDASSDDPIFQEFAAQGQSVFVSSGDHGAYPAFQSYADYFPAEDPYVTAVGGTELATNGAGGTWQSETVWNDPAYGTGSGGGISPDGIAIPLYQAGVANSSNGASSTLRNVPDVAMEANTDNYACDMGVCDGGYGGTSFAAPRWAGFMALVNQQTVAAGQSPVGFINPAIYLLGLGSNYDSDFHDITIGNNDHDAGVTAWYNAVPGYDLVTGWGSPNGQNFINALPAPGFALSASPSNLTIIQGGGSDSSTITVSAVNGFTGSVSLAASGLPSGVTASFSPASIGGSGTSTITLTASSSATSGNATVTITGTSGSLTATTTMALSVNFAFSVTPFSQSVTAGSSTSFTATIVMQKGFTGSVGLSVGGLPAGATGTFTPASLSASGTSTLTVATAGTTPVGSYPLTVTATSGSLTQTVSVTLLVNAVATGFTISAAPASVAIGQTVATDTSTSLLTITSKNNFSSPVTLTATGVPAGVVATFSPNPVTPAADGSITSLLTLSEVTYPAPYGTFPITVTGSYGYQVATTKVTLTVEPLLIWIDGYPGGVTVTQGTTGAVAIYAFSGYSSQPPITFNVTGLPDGVTGAFSLNPLPAPVIGYDITTLTLTAAPTATTGTFPLTVTGGAAGSLSGSLDFTVTVTSSGFTIAASPASLTLPQNGSATSTLTITSQNGFSSPVYLNQITANQVTGRPDGLPDGVTVAFSPNPVTPAPDGSVTTTLTLSSDNATVGTFPVIVNGGSVYGETPSLLAQATPITITVTSAGQPSFVTLSSAFNRMGIFYDGYENPTINLGMDTDGNGYSQNVLGCFQQSFNSTYFWIDCWYIVWGAEDFDVVSGTGQTIPLPSGTFSTLQLLGTGVNGNQASQEFTVAYTDGTTKTITQSFSDWQNPQHYPGETEAVTMAYVDNVYTGGRTPAPTYLYGYSFPLDNTKTVKSVTLPSNSNVELLAMTLMLTPTVTTLSSSPNPSIYGQAVTFTATVTSSDGAPPNGETVTFMNGMTALGTGPLTGGSASLTISALPVGTYSVTAIYGGDANNLGSTSSALTQTVNQADFALTPNPTSTAITAGQSGTFTLTVTPQGSFTSSIRFSCSGLPAHAGCDFSPASVTPNSSIVTSTLKITTTARAASLILPIGRRSRPLYAIWLVLPAMLLGTVGMVAPKRRKLLSYCLVFLLAGGCLLQAACGSGNNGGSGGGGGTPAGTYTVTVAGAAASTQHTTAVTLTVQ